MTKNDITGDKIRSKPQTNAYLSGYDIIFKNKKKKVKKCSTT